jgi:hypothetical protein
MFSRKIMILVTGAAFQAGDTLPIETAPDIHRVPVSVVSLPGEVSIGMAVHTTRMPEHWN